MGQEKYLSGARFRFRRYRQVSPEWDHDHCEFCLRKFEEAPDENSLAEGWATPYMQSDVSFRWICDVCFTDFREEFGFAVDQVIVRYPCPCCGYLTRNEGPPGTYEICPICWWEDDPVQFEDPDFSGGANQPSLNEARKRFRESGAISPDATPHVRAPLPDEVP